MTRTALKLLGLGSFLTLGLLSSGCFQDYTIEPGLWRLDVLRTEYTEVGNQRFETPLNPIGTNVEVVPNWVKRDGEDVETIEIYSTKDPAHSPITGIIYEEQDTRNPERTNLKMKAQGRSGIWDFSLFGSIKSPQRMEGNIFGREIFAGNRSFQGTWTLVKIED